jgi:hypothetical protein
VFVRAGKKRLHSFPVVNIVGVPDWTDFDFERRGRGREGAGGREGGRGGLPCEVPSFRPRKRGTLFLSGLHCAPRPRPSGTNVLRDIFSNAANKFVGIFRQSEKDIQKSREGARERASERKRARRIGEGGREKFRP